jgi:hypothetical protein
VKNVALTVVSTKQPTDWRTSVAGAVVLYLLIRLVSADVIVLAQHYQPTYARLSSTPYLGMTMHWDALWYRRVALHGYPRLLPHRWNGAIAQNAWAFFPGFPFLTRAVMFLSGLPFALAASAVNLTSGVVAACAMVRIFETRIPRAAALSAVAAWAALPMAPALQLAYSEALALALLSVALLCLIRERWVCAAAAAVLLGLTRPILPPLTVAYGVAILRRWRRRSDEPLVPADWGRMVSGFALTAAGSAIWPLVATRVTGVPHAYLLTEAAWHRDGEAPFAGLRALFMPDWLVHGPYAWIRVAIIAAICVALLLTLVALRSRRLDPVLVTWCAAYLVYEVAVSVLHGDEFRLLLPLFPLVAIACGVASRRLARGWHLRAGLLIGLGIVGQYAWVMLFVRFLPGVAHAP